MPRRDRPGPMGEEQTERPSLGACIEAPQRDFSDVTGGDGEAAVAKVNVAATRAKERVNVGSWALETALLVVVTSSVAPAGLLPKYPRIRKLQYSRNERNILGRLRRR